MARTGRVEGAGRQARSVADAGSETGGVGSRRNAQALPCPPVFRPSGRVRWSDCRSLRVPSPGPWLLARRLGEARRPGSGVGVVLGSGVAPTRRHSGGRASRGRVGVRLGAGNGVAPLGGVQEGELLGASRVRGSGGRRYLVLDPGTPHLGAAFRRASFSERRGVRLGAGSAVCSARCDREETGPSRTTSCIVESPEKMRSRREAVHRYIVACRCFTTPAWWPFGQTAGTAGSRGFPRGRPGPRHARDKRPSQRNPARRSRGRH